MTHDLVDGFTNIEDPGKKKLCGLIQSIGNSILGFAIQIASALTIALGNPEIEAALIALDAAESGSVRLDAEILLASERTAISLEKAAANIGAEVEAKVVGQIAEDSLREAENVFQEQLLESSKVTLDLTKDELQRFTKHCTNKELIQKIRAQKGKVTISLKPEEQKKMADLAQHGTLLEKLIKQRQYANELLDHLPARAVAKAFILKGYKTSAVTLEHKGMNFKFNWWDQIKYIPQNNWPVIQSMIPQAKEEYGSLELNGGYGDGGYLKLCSQFEGDFKDQTVPNVQKIQSWIPGQFEFIRKKLNVAYDSFYKGQVNGEGNPSVMGLLMMVNNWTRKDGFLGDLEDAEGWQL